jgi:hypothetical protein
MNGSLRQLTIAAAVAGLLSSAAGGFAQPPSAGEEFHYHWQLRNLVGYIAGLFLPRQGNGELTFKDDGNGHLRSELVITSPDSHDGEFWRYGSEIDSRTLQPLRAWTSYFWRGRSKTKTREIDQKGVLDVVSGLYAIRHDLPKETQRLEIWSDGDIFPAAIIPLGHESLKIGGRSVDTVHYAIRSVDVPGRLKWKGKVDFWFATDPAATPVEIEISRSLADVRLVLQPGMSPPAS